MDERKEIKLGNIYGFTGGNYAGNVYDKAGISPCLSTFGGGNQQPMIVETEKKHKVKVVDIYNKKMIEKNCGTITANGNKSPTSCGTFGIVEVETEKICVAMRGRPTEGSDYSGETEQRLEPNNTGTVNTLTSVAKDNLVLERVTEKKAAVIDDMYRSRGERIYTEDAPTITGRHDTYKVAELESIRINQATAKGYEDCMIGGICDLSFPTSKTRRGRIYDNGEVCPTIVANNRDICRIENGSADDYTLIYEDGEYIYYIKIRKLTPRECWRLMDFKDGDFDRAQEVNSNTQLYKQAGNSIVKNCLVAIIGQMFEGCENRYKENCHD